MATLEPKELKFAKRRRTITLNTKMYIINRRENGERLIDISRSVNLAPSTVRTILDNANKIKASSESATDISASRVCRGRDSRMEKMELQLYLWLEDQNKLSMSLTLMEIQEKARSLWRELNDSDGDDGSDNLLAFKASNGWFERFKRRANLYTNIKKEKSKSLPAAKDKTKSKPTAPARCPANLPTSFQPVTAVCATDNSPKKSTPLAGTVEDLATISSLQTNTTSARSCTAVSEDFKHVPIEVLSEQIGPHDAAPPADNETEVIVEYHIEEPSLDGTCVAMLEDNQQNKENVEEALFQLRAEKLLLELDKLKLERQKMDAERRNIQLRADILSLRKQLVTGKTITDRQSFGTISTRLVQDDDPDISTSIRSSQRFHLPKELVTIETPSWCPSTVVTDSKPVPRNSKLSTRSSRNLRSFHVTSKRQRNNVLKQGVHRFNHDTTNAGRRDVTSTENLLLSQEDSGSVDERISFVQVNSSTRKTALEEGNLVQEEDVEALPSSFPTTTMLQLKDCVVSNVSSCTPEPKSKRSERPERNESPKSVFACSRTVSDPNKKSEASVDVGTDSRKTKIHTESNHEKTDMLFLHKKSSGLLNGESHYKLMDTNGRKSDDCHEDTGSQTELCTTSKALDSGKTNSMALNSPSFLQPSEEMLEDVERCSEIQNVDQDGTSNSSSFCLQDSIVWDNTLLYASDFCGTSYQDVASDLAVFSEDGEYNDVLPLCKKVKFEVLES